jgi:DNA-binding MarR family transcriptional regulator
MTTAPTAYTQFGYTLALAERTLTAVLQDHLAERGVRPETWYALQLLTVRGPVLEREALAADLASSRALNPDSTRELLARLEAEGLIRGDREIELTDDGRALHRSLREYVAVPRDRLLSQFDVEDIETTVRTLRAIAERAAA